MGVRLFLLSVLLASSMVAFGTIDPLSTNWSGPGIWTKDLKGAREYTKGKKNRLILIDWGRNGGGCGNCNMAASAIFNKQEFKDWAATNEIALVMANYDQDSDYANQQVQKLYSSDPDEYTAFPVLTVVDGADGTSRIGWDFWVAQSIANGEGANPGTNPYGYNLFPFTPDTTVGFVKFALARMNDSPYSAKKLGDNNQLKQQAREVTPDNIEAINLSVNGLLGEKFYNRLVTTNYWITTYLKSYWWDENDWFKFENAKAGNSYRVKTPYLAGPSVDLGRLCVYASLDKAIAASASYEAALTNADFVCNMSDLREGVVITPKNAGTVYFQFTRRPAEKTFYKNIKVKDSTGKYVVKTIYSYEEINIEYNFTLQQVPNAGYYFKNGENTNVTETAGYVPVTVRRTSGTLDGDTDLSVAGTGFVTNIFFQAGVTNRTIALPISLETVGFKPDLDYWTTNRTVKLSVKSDPIVELPSDSSTNVVLEIVSNQPEFDEADGADGQADATWNGSVTTLTTGAVVKVRLNSCDTVDCYKFTAKAGKRYAVAVEATRLRGVEQVNVKVYRGNVQATPITGVTSVGSGAYFRFGRDADETVYVKVYRAEGTSPVTALYSIGVTAEDMPVIRLENFENSGVSVASPTADTNLSFKCLSNAKPLGDWKSFNWTAVAESGSSSVVNAIDGTDFTAVAVTKTDLVEKSSTWSADLSVQALWAKQWRPARAFTVRLLPANFEDQFYLIADTGTNCVVTLTADASRNADGATAATAHRTGFVSGKPTSDWTNVDATERNVSGPCKVDWITLTNIQDTVYEYVTNKTLTVTNTVGEVSCTPILDEVDATKTNAYEFAIGIQVAVSNVVETTSEEGASVFSNWTAVTNFAETAKSNYDKTNDWTVANNDAARWAATVASTNWQSRAAKTVGLQHFYYRIKGENGRTEPVSATNRTVTVYTNGIQIATFDWATEIAVEAAATPVLSFDHLANGEIQLCISNRDENAIAEYRLAFREWTKPTVWLGEISVVTNDTVASFEIPVRRGGNTNDAIEVKVNATNLTAIVGSGYFAPDATVLFEANSADSVLTVAIPNADWNAINWTGDRAFELSLDKVYPVSGAFEFTDASNAVTVLLKETNAANGLDAGDPKDDTYAYTTNAENAIEIDADGAFTYLLRTLNGRVSPVVSNAGEQVVAAYATNDTNDWYRFTGIHKGDYYCFGVTNVYVRGVAEKDVKVDVWSGNTNGVPLETSLGELLENQEKLSDWLYLATNDADVIVRVSRPKSDALVTVTYRLVVSHFIKSDIVELPIEKSADRTFYRLWANGGVKYDIKSVSEAEALKDLPDRTNVFVQVLGTVKEYGLNDDLCVDYNARPVFNIFDADVSNITLRVYRFANTAVNGTNDYHFTTNDFEVAKWVRPAVWFDEAAISQDDTNATVCVTLKRDETSDQLAVALAFSNRVAVAGAEYVQVPAQVVFAKGAATADVTVSVPNTDFNARYWTGDRAFDLTLDYAYDVGEDPDVAFLFTSNRTTTVTLRETNGSGLDAADAYDGTKAGAAQHPIAVAKDGTVTNLVRTLNGSGAAGFAVNDTNDWFCLTGIIRGETYIFQWNMDATNAVVQATLVAENGAVTTDITADLNGECFRYVAASANDIYIRVSRENRADRIASVNYDLSASQYLWPYVGFGTDRIVVTNTAVDQVVLPFARWNGTNTSVTVDLAYGKGIDGWAKNVFGTLNPTKQTFAAGETNAFSVVTLKKPAVDCWVGDWSVDVGLSFDPTVARPGAYTNVTITVVDQNETAKDVGDYEDAERENAVAWEAPTTFDSVIARTNHLNGIDVKHGGVVASDTADWVRITGVEAENTYRLTLTSIVTNNAENLTLLAMIESDEVVTNITLATLAGGFDIPCRTANDIFVRVSRTASTEEKPVSVKYALAVEKIDWPIFSISAVKSVVTNSANVARAIVRRSDSLDGVNTVVVKVVDTNEVPVTQGAREFNVVFNPGESACKTVEVELAKTVGFGDTWGGDFTFALERSESDPYVSLGETNATVSVVFRKSLRSAQFGCSEISVNEAADALYVDVVCTVTGGGTLENDAVVTVVPTEDTEGRFPATAEEDFDPTPQEVKWPAGSTGGTKRVRIALANFDTAWEGDETFKLLLESADGMTQIDAPDEVLVTITDMNPPQYGTVGITETGDLTVRECGTFPITLERVDGSSGSVTGLFTWVVGKTKTEQKVELFDDREDGEKTVSLTVPKNATFALSQSATLTFALVAPKKTVEITKGTSTKFTLTVVAENYGGKVSDYAAEDPTRVAFRGATSAWYAGADGESVIAATPSKAGGSSSMTTTVTGPGTLFFDVAFADGANCALAVKMDSSVLTNLTADAEDVSIPVTAAGDKTLTFVFLRGAKGTVATASVCVSDIRFERTAEAVRYGTFTGYACVNGQPGSATLTVSSAGKFSGKFVCADATWSFSGKNGWEDDFVAKAARRTEIPFTLAVDAKGKVTATGEDFAATLWRSSWKDKPLSAETAAAVAAFGGEYLTANLAPETDLLDRSLYGSGYLGFTVSASGAVKASGVLADGTSVSLSGTLGLTDAGLPRAFLFSKPNAYKGGWMFVAPALTKNDGGKTVLRNADCPELDDLPSWTSAAAFDFERTPALVGGFYDKSENLYLSYSSPLTVTRSDEESFEARISFGESGNTLSVDNYDGLFTTSFRRSTGLFSGYVRSYVDQSGRQTRKSYNYKGILTPNGGEANIIGRGFFKTASTNSMDILIKDR